jgi:hypothetical protein
MASKVGGILGLVGSVLMLSNGFSTMSFSLYGYPPGPFEFLKYIVGGVTMVIGVFGMSGSVLALGDCTYGYIFLLVAGGLGVIGTFIPIRIIDFGSGYLSITYLSTTLIYIDPILMIVGGILGLALADKTERKL